MRRDQLTWAGRRDGDHVRQVEVDALDVRVPIDDDAERSTDAASDVHQDVHVVESGAVDIEQGGHGGLGEPGHDAVQHLAAIRVLLHELPRGDAVRAFERRDGGVEHGLVQVLERLQKLRGLHIVQQGQEGAALRVVHQESPHGRQGEPALILVHDLAEDLRGGHHAQEAGEVSEVRALPRQRERRELGGREERAVAGVRQRVEDVEPGERECCARDRCHCDELVGRHSGPVEGRRRVGLRASSIACPAHVALISTSKYLQQMELTARATYWIMQGNSFEPVLLLMHGINSIDHCR
jgi:hypothetical protein